MRLCWSSVLTPAHENVLGEIWGPGKREAEKERVSEGDVTSWRTQKRQ